MPPILAAHRQIRDRRSHGFGGGTDARDFGRCAISKGKAGCPTVIIATRLPTKQMLIMDFQRARIWCSAPKGIGRELPLPPVAADVKYFAAEVVLVGNTGRLTERNNDYRTYQQPVRQRHFKMRLRQSAGGEKPPTSAVTTADICHHFFRSLLPNHFTLTVYRR